MFKDVRKTRIEKAAKSSTTSFLYTDHTSRTVKKGCNVICVCKYCEKEVSTSAKFIDHLAGKRGNVKECAAVPAFAKKAAQDHLVRNQEARKRKVDAEEEVATKRLAVGTPSTQRSILNFASRTKDEAADMAVAMLLYECGVSFNVLDQPAWKGAMTEHGKVMMTSCGAWACGTVCGSVVQYYG